MRQILTNVMECHAAMEFASMKSAITDASVTLDTQVNTAPRKRMNASQTLVDIMERVQTTSMATRASVQKEQQDQTVNTTITTVRQTLVSMAIVKI